MKCPNCESKKNAPIRFGDFGDNPASIEYRPCGTRMNCLQRIKVNVCLDCGTIFVSRADCRNIKNSIEGSGANE